MGILRGLPKDQGVFSKFSFHIHFDYGTPRIKAKSKIP
jgi:hypothetical protein